MGKKLSRFPLVLRCNSEELKTILLISGTVPHKKAEQVAKEILLSACKQIVDSWVQAKAERQAKIQAEQTANTSVKQEVEDEKGNTNS